jgi:hypothetical protein
MCVWANTPDEGTRSSIVNSSFNWYSPGVIEGYYYCCNRGTTMDDPVWSTMGKISDNQSTISDLRGTTVLNSYKNAWTSWNMYNFAILSYGGGQHEGTFHGQFFHSPTMTLPGEPNARDNQQIVTRNSENQ